MRIGPRRAATSVSGCDAARAWDCSGAPAGKPHACRQLPFSVNLLPLALRPAAPLTRGFLPGCEAAAVTAAVVTAGGCWARRGLTCGGGALCFGCWNGGAVGLVNHARRCAC
ncbi:hypothetical protein AAFF_G00016080 [Aldrovandia affinis]|uniref:Uncharacterized protein n=1 Tax=Aldrovandia affinis TaxID=143900 RepID=A0AAD7S5U5_9TELE|nr:hypothetical protein AAFF_G00016080 [Aldrovandia affinis]